MRIIIFLFLALFIASCGEKHIPDKTQTATNKPYKISGQWYYPLLKADGYDEKGIASWYGKDFHGKKTSNGERYDMHALSAAHPTLPMGTKVRVTNLENGKSMVLRINDRGPFVKERLIDLSYAAAKQMGYARKGTTRVRVQTVDENATTVHVTRYISPKPRIAVEKRREVTVTPIRNLPQVTSVNQPQPAIATAKVIASQKQSTRPTAKPLEAMPASATSKRYYVQLAAFSSAENAEKLRQEYIDRFPKLKIFTTLGEIPMMYKVRQGPFDRRNKAEEVASHMEIAGVSHLSLAQDYARPTTLRMQMPKPISKYNENQNLVAANTTVPKAMPYIKKTNVKATAKSQSGKMYVQIGAFSSFERAQQLRNRYVTQFASTQVYNPSMGESKVYRVRIGPIKNPRSVSSMVDRLESSGVKKAIIVIGK